MKARHLLSLFLFVMVFALSAFAHETDYQCLSEKEYSCFIAQKGDKIYINPEAIVIYNNGIYLNVDNNPMPVSGLFSDGEGIYISKDKEEKKGWICPVCNYYNPPEARLCGNYRNHKYYQPDNR